MDVHLCDIWCVIFRPERLARLGEARGARKLGPRGMAKEGARGRPRPPSPLEGAAGSNAYYTMIYKRLSYNIIYYNMMCNML